MGKLAGFIALISNWGAAVRWGVKLGESVKSHYHKLGREGKMSELAVRTSSRPVSE